MRSAIGDRPIRAARKANGLTATELAAMVGVSGHHLNQCEIGARSASPALLERIADALDVSVEELSGIEPLRSTAERAYEEGHVIGYDEGFEAGYSQALIDSAVEEDTNV